jgi:predicted phosphodiesterase
MSFVVADSSFAVFGHVYPDLDAVEESVEKLNSIDIDFVIFTGDSIHAPDSDWPELKGIISEINVPVYFVAGNHDYQGTQAGGYFLNEMSEELYYSFNVGNDTFIVLNSVITESTYDVNIKQVEFVRDAILTNTGDVYVFVHHCLFYNQDNNFCNSKEYFKDNVWNDHLVPILQNEKVAGVFVGDVGVNEPYFSVVENNVRYYGVGFSPEHSRIQFPEHFLHVTVDSVEPVVIRNDISEVVYESRVDKSMYGLARSYIKKNLPFVFKLVIIIFILMFLKIVILSYIVWKKRDKKAKDFLNEFG